MSIRVNSQTSKNALETSIGDVPETAGKTVSSKKAYENAKYI